MEKAAVLSSHAKSSLVDIFTHEFCAADTSHIVRRIKENGYYSVSAALRPEFIDAVKTEIAEHRFTINKNWVTGVYAENQYYLTHMLACSSSFYHLVTHPKVFTICDGMLGDSYRLKAMRYYETYGGHHMQWHTDNKTDKSFAHIPGIIFIAYLDDIHEGEFQYIRGSHAFSGIQAYNDYTDDYITNHHAQDIMSFKGPKGTVVIYDTYGIHRAKPVFNRSFIRKSLFFQIDADCRSAEPILLNPAYISHIDDRIAKYFGFGLPAEYRVFPHTGIRNLPLKRVIFSLLPFWILHRIVRGTYEILPASIKNIIRSTIKNKESGHA